MQRTLHLSASHNMPPQSSSNEPPIFANGMALRAHRNKNVGAPDMKRPRRPNGEVATEKAEKKIKKINDDKLRKQKLHEVARLEQAVKVANKENHQRPIIPARSKVTLEHPESIGESDPLSYVNSSSELIKNDRNRV